MMDNSWNADDTPTEAALRTAAAGLRGELRRVIEEAQAALGKLDDGYRAWSSLSPGRVLDDRAVNGYAAQMDVLLTLPWSQGFGNESRALDIVRTAGRKGDAS